MTSGILETINLTVPVRLFKAEVSSGESLYLASIHNIACGSGKTPEEAYAGLAHCLAVGDEDVPGEDAIEPWKAIIEEALDRAHGIEKVATDQMTFEAIAPNPSGDVPQS